MDQLRRGITPASIFLSSSQLLKGSSSRLTANSPTTKPPRKATGSCNLVECSKTFPKFRNCLPTAPLIRLHSQQWSSHCYCILLTRVRERGRLTLNAGSKIRCRSSETPLSAEGLFWADNRRLLRLICPVPLCQFIGSGFGLEVTSRLQVIMDKQACLVKDHSQRTQKVAHQLENAFNNV